jgi:2-octaprenyl-6-methoxyphenol hydroxylase
MSLPIQIRGRGPIASALALFLLEEGFSPDELLIPESPLTLPDWLGARAIALSLGSLELLGASLPELAPRNIRASPELAAPIESVAVLRAGAMGRTLIESQHPVPGCLGAVLRYESLHRLMVSALHDRLGPVARSQTVCEPDDELDGQTHNITVIADGDTQPGSVKRFDQQALIAEVEVSGGQPGRAWERFTDEGPLALLPLPGPGGHRRALVWCAPSEATTRRCSLDERSIETELQGAFGPALGSIRMAGSRFATDLQRLSGEPRIGPMSVAIGNAAQSLHPVAGQGLNLGLRDARVLARCLGDVRARRPIPSRSGAREQGSDSDTDAWRGALDRYCELRRGDRRSLIGITDALASLTTRPELRPVQSLALGAIELCSPLKAWVRHTFTHGFRKL